MSIYFLGSLCVGMSKQVSDGVHDYICVAAKRCVSMTQFVQRKMLPTVVLVHFTPFHVRIVWGKAIAEGSNAERDWLSRRNLKPSVKV